MVYSLDTNIFVYGIYNPIYLKVIKKFYDNRYESIIPYSLSNEIRKKCLQIYTILLQIKNKLEKKEDSKNINEINELKLAFDKIYLFFKGKSNNFKDWRMLLKNIKNKISDLMTYFAYLNDIPYYPERQEEMIRILSGSRDIKEELSKMKNMHGEDISHLIIFNYYCENKAINLGYFVTEDYHSLLINKKEIEKKLEFTEIITSQEYLNKQEN